MRNPFAHQCRFEPVDAQEIGAPQLGGMKLGPARTVVLWRCYGGGCPQIKTTLLPGRWSRADVGAGTAVEVTVSGAKTGEGRSAGALIADGLGIANGGPAGELRAAAAEVAEWGLGRELTASDLETLRVIAAGCGARVAWQRQHP